MEYFEKAKSVFNYPRPKTFLDNPNHCEECAEAELKAQNATIDSLTLDENGQGWADLHNFLNNNGFLYYFPAFIRLCLETTTEEGFLDSFLFSLTTDKENNSKYQACTLEQKAFVCEFLKWYKTNHSNLVEHWLVEEDIKYAIALWCV